MLEQKRQIIFQVFIMGTPMSCVAVFMFGTLFMKNGNYPILPVASVALFVAVVDYAAAVFLYRRMAKAAGLTARSLFSRL